MTSRCLDGIYQCEVITESYSIKLDPNKFIFYEKPNPSMLIKLRICKLLFILLPFIVLDLIKHNIATKHLGSIILTCYIISLLVK